MQIPSIPPPIVTNTLPQDIVAKAVPNMQAAPPLVQRAIDPSPKSEKFNQTRSNRDRSKGGDHSPGEDDDPKDDKPEDHVNIKV
jgi:hypothetical protein